MKCLSCKNGNMLSSTTTYFTEFNNCMLIIKNVPCMKCEQCVRLYSPHQFTAKLSTLP